MRKTGKCPKCGGTKIVCNAELSDRGHLWIREQASVRAYANPEAPIFKGARDLKVSADICGECGYIELYAESPELFRLK